MKKMKENENELAAMTGFKVSYKETAGTKLGRIFSLDLAKDQPCGRPVNETPGEKGNQTVKQGASHMNRDVLYATQTTPTPSQQFPSIRKEKQLQPVMMGRKLRPIPPLGG